MSKATLFTRSWRDCDVKPIQINWLVRVERGTSVDGVTVYCTCGECIGWRIPQWGCANKKLRSGNGLKTTAVCFDSIKYQRTALKHRTPV